MPELLSFFRPFRYDQVSRVLVVETGAGHRMPGVLGEMHRLFPEARLDVLLREEDAELAPQLDADSVRVVSFEERASLLRELRPTRFDLVVFQLSKEGAQGLRSLPFALRSRNIVAVNDSLDHFPINLFRIRDLALHFGLASQGVGILLGPALFAYLLGTTGFLYARGMVRRLTRSLRGGAGRRDSGGDHASEKRSKARAAASEGR